MLILLIIPATSKVAGLQNQLMFKPKKSLGQNFLKSKKVLDDIINAGKISVGETVLEIGPGKGALTEKLIEAKANVIAIEKDDRLIEELREKFPDIKIIHGDVLKFEPSSLPELASGSYKLIANIPYYITGEIIEKFLSCKHPPETIVLLVQKEVAQRIVSRDKKESILSIAVKAYGTPKYIGTVSKRYFSPAPKVDSAIIAIENIHPLVSPLSQGSHEDFEKHFFSVLKTGFAHKRKKVLSNLKEKYDISDLNIPENTRAEELSIEKWLDVARVLRSI